jgi:Domain of unknown function (DUF4864)
MHDNTPSFLSRKILKKSLGIFLLLCILVGGAVGYLYFSMIQTANHFMQSIFQEDIQSAYTFIVPSLQEKISYENFEKAVKTAYSDNTPDIPVQWEEYTMRYKIAYVSWRYETTKGVSVRVEIELMRQGIDWKVSYFKSR